MTAQPLVLHPHPFAPAQRIDGAVPAGSTLAQALAKAGLPPRLHAHVRIWVEDWEVPRDLWATARPKAGRVVYIKVFPHGGGGGGGGKNPIATVLSLALLVAAPALAGSLYSAMGGTFVMASAGLMVSAIGVGIGLLGNMAINALFPPPAPAKSAYTAYGQTAPSYQITGTRNQFSPYANIPRVFGRRRIYPLQAARPYSESQGSDQYVRLLLLVGYGPLRISDIRIGETPISAFSGVEVEVSEGGPEGWAGNSPITLYTQAIREDDLSVALAPDAWQTRTTRTDTDEISIDIGWPRGLVHFNDDGSLGARGVEVAVEYRAVDSAVWLRPTWLNAADVGAGVAGVLSGVEATQSAVRRSGRWKVPVTGQYEVRVRRTTPAGSSRDVDATYWAALRSVTHQAPVTQRQVCLIALRIKASEQLNGTPDSINCIAESYLPVRTDGVWDWQLTRNAGWAAVDLLRRRGHETLMTDSRIDLDRYEEFAAWCNATAPNADEPYWSYDGVVDGGSIFTALHDVLSHARASYNQRDGKHSVVWDAAQSVPAQHISPRNSWGYQGSKKFADLPHALKIKFTNADKGYVEDELPVYADGYNADGADGLAVANRFETQEYYGCTRASQAWRIGRYLLAYGQLRPEEHSVYQDIESLRVSKGDLVHFAHDVILVGLYSGRIASVSSVDGRVAAITLDGTVAMSAGVAYGLRIRRADGSSLVAGVVTTPGESDVLTLSNPIPDALGPLPGDLVMFGEAGRESMPCLVKQIERGPDLTARMTLVDAAPGIWTADSGPIPPYDSIITLPPDPTQLRPAAPIIVLRADESAVTLMGDGTVIERLIVDIRPPRASGVPVAEYQSEWRELDETVWRPGHRAAASVAEIVLQPAIRGRVYVVRVRAISEPGEVSDWTYADPQPVTGVTAPPPPVPGLTATGGLFTVDVTWQWPADQRVKIRSLHVWGSTQNNRANAVELFNEPWPSLRRALYGLSPGTTWYLWAWIEDTSGNRGAWYPASPTAGVAGTVSTDATALLAQLDGALGLPQLAAELAAPIARIEPGLRQLERAADIAAQAQLAALVRGEDNAERLADGIAIAEQTLRTSIVEGLSAEAQARTQLAAAMGSELSEAAAALSDERTARAAADAAEAMARQALAAQFGNDLAAAISDESTARAAADAAEATARQALAAQFGNDLAAAISDERTTRAAADTAEAAARQALAAQLGNDFAAAISDERTARAAADATEATARQALEAQFGDNLAAVQQQAQATASALGDVNASWSLMVQAAIADRLSTAGLSVVAGADGSAIVMSSDKLLWYVPGSTSPVPAFVAGTVNGAVGFGISGNLLVDGGIAARHLAARSITAGSAVIDDAAINTLHVADGAITLSAFASDNGYERWLTAGSFGAGAVDDVFSSVSFPTRAGDEITVEAYCFIRTEAYSGALDVLTLRPHLLVDGVDVVGGVSATWRKYDASSHVAVVLKGKIAGNGGTRTATLAIAASWPAFYNDTQCQYRISGCVLSAFIRRR